MSAEEQTNEIRRPEAYFDIIDVKRDIYKEERAIRHYISTNHVDRGKDIINPKGMDDTDFKKSPTVFFNHDYDKPIGKSIYRERREDGVIAKTVFSKTTELAEDVYNLHLENILNTWSIGFRPGKKEDDIVYDQNTGIRTINNWELIEYSSAPLAMNPNCLDQAKNICKSLEMKKVIANGNELLKINIILDTYKNEIALLKKIIGEFRAEDRQLEKTIIDLKEEMKKIYCILQKEAEKVGIKLSQDKIKKLVTDSLAGAFSDKSGKIHQN